MARWEKKPKRGQTQADGAGDLWDPPAVAADSTLVVRLVVGTRPQEPTQALGQDARGRLRAGHVPAIFTDADAGDAAAIVEACGPRDPGPRLRAPGRASRSVLRKGRGERIAVRARYGTARRKPLLPVLGYQQINTRVVERHNGTSRRRNQRKVRKTLAVSKAPRSHRGMRWRSVGLYTFCRGHSRVKSLQEKPVQQRRPAMAAR